MTRTVHDLAPSGLTPAQFEADDVFSMFPDLQHKRIKYDSQRHQDPKINWIHSATNIDDEGVGGFGAGKSGSGPRQVDVVPEIEQKKSKTRARQSLQPNAGEIKELKPVLLVDYFKLLTDALKLVKLNSAPRLGGYPPDPDSVALTTRPPTLGTLGWEYLKDQKSGEIRSRRARIVELSELSTKFNLEKIGFDSLVTRYLYILELERQREKGSSLLMIEAEEGRKVEDYEFENLLKKCLESQGQWQQLNELKTAFENRVDIPGLRLKVVKHHWQDDHKKLAVVLTNQWNSSASQPKSRQNR